MQVQQYNEKMRCICCKKVIPKSKIFMLSKEIEIIDGLQEVMIRHICGYCNMYVTALRQTISQDNLDKIVQVLSQH